MRPALLLLSLTCSLAWAQAPLLVVPHKPDPPIAVDGNLAEWAVVPNALEVRGKGHVTWNVLTWQGPDDLGATVRLAWRGEGLYLAADVTDDVLLQQQRDEKLYQGDHLEWFLDLAPDVEPGRHTFGKGQFQFAFSPGNFRTTGDPIADIRPEVYCYQPKGADVSSLKFAALRTPHGWTMEALVPWAVLGVRDPAPNLPLNLEVALSDCDSSEPAQESYMTLGTAEWAYGRQRLQQAVLGDVAGKGSRAPVAVKVADEIIVAPGETREVALPAVTVSAGLEAYLCFKVRLPSEQPAGYNPALRAWLGGIPLGSDRAANRPAQSLRNNGTVHLFITGDGLLYVPYGPDFTATDRDPDYGLQKGVKAHEWELRVTDLLRPQSTLKLLNTTAENVKRDLILGQVELRLKAPPPPPVARRAAPTGPLPVYEPRPDGGPKLGLREAAEARLTVTCGDQAYTVQSRFSTPDGQWVTGSNRYFSFARTAVVARECVLVRDTFRNLTAEPLPLMQRHSIDLRGRVRKTWCAGVSPASGNITMAEPANPTSFATTDRGGVGLMPLNDEFQVHVMNSALDGVLGLGDDTYVLRPGGTYTAEWVVVPVARPDFWDFVNACRRLRKVNFPLTQMFAFLTPTPQMQPLLATRLAEFIGNKSANVVCSGIEYPRYKGRYAHGTVLSELDLSVHARHNDRVRQLCPGVKTEFYYHCYLDVGDEAASKYADCRTLLADGTQATYGQPTDRIFFPTLDNSFGRDMGKIIDLIWEGCKADGVYWDEMAYSRYRYHYGEPWDGCSGDIDPATGKLLRRKASVTLLSQPFVLYHARRIMARGPLLANGAPHTRSLANLHFQTFVETAAISNCLRAILYSPVALGDHISERTETDAYRWMVSALDYGCLYSWYSYQVWAYHETLAKYMFPTTPVELHEGFIIGRERIVTNRSGLFGWGDRSQREVHVFDDEGKEVPGFKAPTVTRNGNTYTELRLAEGCTAAIVRK